MTTSPPDVDSSVPGPRRRLRAALGDGTQALVALAVAAVLVAVVVARMGRLPWVNVNWDEFYFLSRIHDLRRGELAEPLLTFHTRLLAWVPRVAAGEIDQVIAIRVVMAALAVVTVVAACAIGRRLGGSLATALLGALAGQSLTYVVVHGFAARFDPPLVALCTTTLALLLVPRRAALVGAAASFAVAFLITLKAGLYAPTVLAFLLLRPTPRRAADVGVFAGVFAGVFGVLFAWHKATLAPLPPVVVASDGRSAGSMLQRALPGGLVVKVHTVDVTWQADRALWVALLLAVVVVVVVAVRDRARRANALLVLSLAAPLLTVVGYRNAFAYFYVSVFPTAAIAIGVGVAFVAAALPRRRAVDVVVAVAVVVSALAFARPAARLLLHQKNEVRAERAVLAGVHDVFPTPVPYVDRCGMVASYPKVGPFMSTWGLEAYRAAGRPDLTALLTTKRPQFVLANVSALRLDKPADTQSPYRLLPDDAAALRENFVPHWGPLWVAGHVVDVPAVGAASFEHRIPGRYRLEAPGAVRLDGARVEPGAVVTLAEGRHELATLDGSAATVTLRTVAAGPAPSSPPPSNALFTALSREPR
jgi:hypothetical protein